MERLGLLIQQERAARIQFDHDPHRPWDRPGAHSLPPAPDKPNHKPKTDPAEKARLYAAVRQMLAQGRSSKAIAKALGLDIKRVYGMKHRLVHGLVVATEVDAKQLPQKPAHTSAPPVRQPLPLRPIPEPPRVFVLDWCARMNAYAFDGEPWPKCKPKKSKTRRVVPCKADFRNVYGYPHPGKGMWTNSTPQEVRRRSEQGRRARAHASDRSVCAINCAARAPAPFD